MGAIKAVDTRVSLVLGDVDRVKVSVTLVPYMSVLASTWDAVGGLHSGVPPEWRNHLLSIVSPVGRAAVSRVTDPTVGIVPDSLMPHLGDRPAADVTWADSLERIRSSDPAGIQRDLFSEFRGRPPSAWQPTMDRPSDWITTWGDVVTAVGQSLIPLWKSASSLLEREIERVGVATSRGATAALLGRLNSQITCVKGELRFSHVSPGRHELAGRELVLVPMVSGDRMYMTHFDLPDQVIIAYAGPGLGPVWERRDEAADRAARRNALGRRSAEATHPPLVALLGAVRARVLLELGGTTTMGRLTDAIGTAPSTVTAAVEHLGEAGLVVRTRRGRIVNVERTELGERLLGMYAC